MSAHVRNLNRAATLVRRLADIEGGPQEFDGVSLADIAADCMLAANELKMREIADGFLYGASVPDNVVALHDFSRRVGA